MISLNRTMLNRNDTLFFRERGHFYQWTIPLICFSQFRTLTCLMSSLKSSEFSLAYSLYSLEWIIKNRKLKGGHLYRQVALHSPTESGFRCLKVKWNSILFWFIPRQQVTGYLFPLIVTAAKARSAVSLQMSFTGNFSSVKGIQSLHWQGNTKWDLLRTIFKNRPAKR